MGHALRLQADLDRHCTALAGCARCPSRNEGVLPVLSDARAPLGMLVGQAPGRIEVTERRPFAGRAGRTLFRWFERAGLTEHDARRELYIAAITRCYPGPHPAGRGDRVPTSVEQATCGDWLADELRLIKPPLLVLVGRLAIDRFLPALPLDGLVGRAISVDHEGGTSLAIPLPHPSGASSWIHAPGHGELLTRALDLLRTELANVRLAKDERKLLSRRIA